MTTNVDDIGKPVNETKLVGDMFQQIQELRSTHPEWFAYFEDADPDTAPRAELVELMSSAPNDAVKFFLLGKYMMRITIASVTGREFR